MHRKAEGEASKGAALSAPNSTIDGGGILIVFGEQDFGGISVGEPDNGRKARKVLVKGLPEFISVP